jgi:hypothetical protein
MERPRHALDTPIIYYFSPYFSIYTPTRHFSQLAVILLRFDMVLVVQEKKVKKRASLSYAEKKARFRSVLI